MINDLLNQNCLIIPITKNSYGKEIKGEPIFTNCRVKEEFKLVKNQAAQEVVSNFEFWFNPEIPIQSDREGFNFIIDYKGEQRVIAMKPKYDLFGNIARLVVYC